MKQALVLLFVLALGACHKEPVPTPSSPASKVAASDSVTVYCVRHATWWPAGNPDTNHAFMSIEVYTPGQPNIWNYEYLGPFGQGDSIWCTALCKRSDSLSIGAMMGSNCKITFKWYVNDTLRSGCTVYDTAGSPYTEYAISIWNGLKSSKLTYK